MTKRTGRNKKKTNITYRLNYVMQTYTTVTQYSSVHHNTSAAVKQNLSKADIHVIQAAKKFVFPNQFWLQQNIKHCSREI